MKILVVVAHPDDVDFGAGGTIANWVAQGDEVIYCLVTDGQAGGSDNTVTRELHWLGFQDGAVVADLNLRREISAVIRIVKPDRVLTQSAERNYSRIYASHPDHLATGEATICAIYPDARNEFAFPELLSERGLAPHAVPETWVMAGPNPKHFVDTTDVLDKKIAALLCHHSQHPDPAGLPARMRSWGEMIAQAGGLPEGRTAEAFLIIDTK